MTIAVDRRAGILSESLLGDIALIVSFALLAFPTVMTLSADASTSSRRILGKGDPS